MKPCPEGFKWDRVDGGYMCQKGGHGMTDEMIKEGMGGICAMNIPRDWANKEGPYYATFGGDHMWNTKKTFPGVLVPIKHREKK